MQGTRLEQLASLALSVCAIGMTGAVVHQEFFRSRAVSVRPSAALEYVKGWNSLVGSGRLVGDSAARVTVVEFMDLECPFCRQLNSTLQTLKKTYRTGVAYEFVHYPLPGHRFASIAARAAECGAAAGRFTPIIDALYAQQDSFGIRPWAAYAANAGISDTAACCEPQFVRQIGLTN